MPKNFASLLSMLVLNSAFMNKFLVSKYCVMLFDCYFHFILSFKGHFHEKSVLYKHMGGFLLGLKYEPLTC
jgi:hypothetical protein